MSYWYGKHVVLFLLSKYSDKLYDNIDYRTQIEMNNLIQVQASFVFAAISEFWFLAFSRVRVRNSQTQVNLLFNLLLREKKF